MSRSLETSGVEVPVAGGVLAAFRLGQRPDGAPTMLAIHGILSNSRAWLAVARALGGRASLVALDLRGRGRSNELPPPYGIDVHVEDALATLDALGLEQAVLAGHSLGAYIAANVAVSHPGRVRAVVLVDGGLAIPGTEHLDPQAATASLLGPALARLKMTFETREKYHEWWRGHPAFAGGAIADHDLVAFADHDLVGAAPPLRPGISEAAVRADAAGLREAAEAAPRLDAPATLLVAPRGLLDDPNPMQPLAVARAWAEQRPAQRHLIAVPDVNHYTITMGAQGAAAVADAIAGYCG